MRWAGKNRQEDFAASLKCPDRLFFKVDLDAVFLEFPYRCEAVHRVSCEPRYGLRNNQLNLAVQGVLHHAGKSLALFHGSPRHAFIRIHPCELPIRAALDVVGVIIHLGGVGCLLVFVVRGNSCIRRDFTFFCSCQRHFREFMDAGRDDRHTSHRAHVLSIVCIPLAAAFEQHRISPASLAAHGRSR